MTMALLNIGLSVPGLAVWRWLMSDLRPTFTRSLAVPSIYEGAITLDSDYRGLT
jgi:hypothetical protein